MKTRGQRPRRKKLIWSPEFAYAVGLLVTDGSMSKDGRHFDFTSNDIEQLKNFMKCLDINVKIGYKKSGYSGKISPHVQFGDVVLYDFLLTIGIMPNKTKIIGELVMPKEYFFDFLRGHHDGDGCFYSYWDPRWKSSFMYYLTFVSASKNHIIWLQDKINEYGKVRGRVSKNKSHYQLRYAKKESLVVLRKMYYSKKVICLSRKRLKIEKALSIVDEHL